MNETIYRKFTCVDVGSTNSQIARRFEWHSGDGNWKTVSKNSGDQFSYLLKTPGGRYDFPTVIVCKDELPAGQAETMGMTKDAVTDETALAMHNMYYSASVPMHSEFKKDLYFSVDDLKDPANEAKFNAAAKYMKLFLKAMKEREEAEAGYACSEETSYITVPVRATGFLRDNMKKWAEEAGWVNPVIIDETDGILNYALNGPDSGALRKKMSVLTRHQSLKILILDIGGSTADMLLLDVHPDGNGGIDARRLGVWPDPGETDTLGGIDVDKKLCQWMLDNEYLLPDRTEESLRRDGYRVFREFKETVSSVVKKNYDGGIVQALTGDITNLAYYKKAFAPKDYDDASSQKLDKDVYVKALFAEYAAKLRSAVRTLLDDCGVKEEDVDGIILSGGGSQMYGIEELFRGTLPIEGEPLRFGKISQDPSALVMMVENASALCALGNVLPKQDVAYKKDSLFEYYLRLTVYTKPASAEGLGDKTFFGEHGVPDIPPSFSKRYSIRWTLIERNEALPKSIDCEDETKVHIEGSEVSVVVIKVYSRKEEDDPQFQYGACTTGWRTPSTIARYKLGTYDPNCAAKFSIGVHFDENGTLTIHPRYRIKGQWGLMGGDGEIPM